MRLNKRKLLKIRKVVKYFFILNVLLLSLYFYIAFSGKNWIRSHKKRKIFASQLSKQTKIFLNSSSDDERSLIISKLRPTSPDSRHGNQIQSKLQIKKRILVWQMRGEGFPMILEYMHDNDYTASASGIELNSPFCGRCSFTNDRSLFDESDALLFPKQSHYDLPIHEKRRSNQIFVWWTQEGFLLPPTENYTIPDLPLNYINWTLTHRRSSDVYSPYNTLPWILKLLWNKERGDDLMLRLAKLKAEPFASPQHLRENIADKVNTNIPHNVPDKIKELLAKKDRTAVWIVSNCGRQPAAAQRLAYCKNLTSAGLKVNVFGACGEGPFPIRSRWEPSFFEAISRYKFYLSFENCVHCIDYMSEKLWLNSLYSGAVPIIFGPSREDVAAVLPPKSYIHVEDFKDPSSLSSYLNYLENNVTAYAEYLEWRTWTNFFNEKGEFDPVNDIKTKKKFQNMEKNKVEIVKKYMRRVPTGFCLLCRKLHEIDN